MINTLVDRFVDAGLRCGAIAEEDRELNTFSLCVMFEQLFTWASIMGLSFIWTSFFETVVFSLLYIPLRIYAGGYHARTFAGCYTFSLATYIIINLIVQQLTTVSFGFGVVVVISIVIIVIKAPIADPNKPADANDVALYRKMLIRILLIELCTCPVVWVWGNDRYLLFIGFAYIQLAVMLLLSPLSLYQSKREP